MNDRFFTRLVIIVLVLINLGTLGFIWVGHQRLADGPPRPGGAPKDVVGYLTKQLGLTSGQQDTIAELQNNFKRDIREAEENYRSLHPPYFNQLQGADVDSAKVEQALDALTEGSRKIEELTFNHFRKVRAVCNPGQQKRFDEIVNDVMHMLAPPQRGFGGQPPPGGPRDGNGPPPGQEPPPGK